ncbi:hypothetical protein AKJ16_DCAP15312 [Drosera capensis]
MRTFPYHTPPIPLLGGAVAPKCTPSPSSPPPPPPPSLPVPIISTHGSPIKPLRTPNPPILEPMFDYCLTDQWQSIEIGADGGESRSGGGGKGRGVRKRAKKEK